MNDDLVVTDSLVIPAVELRWAFGPSGGPGGQHANRAHTRAELRWSPATSDVLTPHQRAVIIEQFGEVVIVTADDHRSQHRNKTDAAQRLASRLRDALHTPEPRRPTRPSRSARQRRTADKRRRGRLKQDRRRPGIDD